MPKINYIPDVMSDWDCYIVEKANKARKKKDIKREKTREKSRYDRGI